MSKKKRASLLFRIVRKIRPNWVMTREESLRAIAELNKKLNKAKASEIHSHKKAMIYQKVINYRYKASMESLRAIAELNKKLNKAKASEIHSRKKAMIYQKVINYRYKASMESIMDDMWEETAKLDAKYGAHR
jgi:hypothetical protein